MSDTLICASCGGENPAAAKFCMECASPLAAPAATPEERKTVTTLFCDLVAFTAMSEDADPEDVDAVLRRYHAAARKVVESHGGTVEKFIGDAVVGVFGVPAVHEDDPERAVRAGLRIVEALEGMTRPDGSPLQVRVGVNTGEALVRLDVTAGSGEGFLTGDAVNTAARLQAAAPPSGVAVGALTRELIQHAIVFEELPPVTAKGKSEPVAAWLAKATISRTGADTFAGSAAPFVGREVELAYLEALFDKATSATPQFALVVGEPGIGKSRLVQELFGHVDARPEMTTWRQGHCLPYGEGVTFWALGEIVKSQAGILDTDSRDVVEAKLEAVLPDGEDRVWFGQRLRPLLGLESPPADREENFTAWLRFLEEMTASGPTVLVFEDLHWADEALLAFLEHLSSHMATVPLMVVGTARPELFEKHAGFAAGGSRVNRIGLDPLSGAETERLVASLMAGPAASADAAAEIAHRCDGNPFYAEESVRLLAETASAALPASVQAVIAARLDALPADHKALLGVAAVVGGVFWNGAVVALDGRDADEVDQALRSLVDRQLVRRVRASSMDGENEFAFAHALAREVAYQELPRSVRAAKHAAVAGWLEDKLGGRVGDAAEVLAHHYVTALDMALATGDEGLADQLRVPAIENLRLAGDRVMRLDVGAAEQLYKRAVDLLGTDDSRRATLLRSWGWSLLQRSRYADAAAAFEDASDLYRAQGQRTDLALALNGLGVALTHLGRPWRHLVDEMLDLISTEEASPEAGEVLTAVASIAVYEADYQRGIALLERVREMYAQLGLAAPATVSFWEAQARCGLGDAQAPRVLRETVAALTAEGYSREVGLVYINSGPLLFPYEGPACVAAFCEEGLDFASQRGMEEAVSMLADNRAANLFTVGRWPEALRELDRIDTSTPDDQVSQRMYNRMTRAQLLVLMGRHDEAEADAAWAEQRARDTGVETLADYAVLVAASVQAWTRSTAESADKLAEVLGHDRPPVIRGDEELFPWLSRVALDDDRPELVGRMMGSLKTAVPLCGHVLVNCRALLEEHGNDHEAAAAGFAGAAVRWHDFGMPYEEAQALLGQGRCLMALGRVPEAAAPLAAAREIFARLGARPALAETEQIITTLSPEGSS
jgi:class 3 adenylate cyclase/tetratricopeptide (TPR) repeat protein